MEEKKELLDQDERVVEIELERLRGFVNHPFKVQADSQMIELQESIKKYGILNPLIVRPRQDGTYEIISGHRRKFAAEKIGYRKVPVIIRVLKDDEAVVSMVDSNLQREMISPSEKAFAYKMKYEAIKRKAGRRKCGQVDHNLGKKSIELIGEECGDSPKQVQRYIPLQNLPITVGKMAGAVDLVLNDQSVSRLHARISRDGNRFFITDLNSTNGTFRNGMRLEPNASEIIEPYQTPFLPGYCG